MMLQLTSYFMPPPKHTHAHTHMQLQMLVILHTCLVRVCIYLVYEINGMHACGDGMCGHLLTDDSAQGGYPQESLLYLGMKITFV